MRAKNAEFSDQERRFVTEIEVRVTDLNYGGHLANDRVLSFFHEARVRFLSSLGLSERDIGEGISLTQTEAFVQYKSEAFLGERLACAVWPQEIGRVRFRLAYELTELNSKRLVAFGTTELAGFDYASRRVCRLPDLFKKALANL
ncbi:MAG: acyl-CoA thioesterase [candidate division KSB1 bacterium]|nr:acyl-CoA thioesterase [candidate division KSB1 bacterium]